MTPANPADPASPDDATVGPSSGGDEKDPRDLRFTSAEQGGVRVERDMSGQGHLSRGSRTNMSNMRFSVKAQPRQELDPELQALRPVASPTTSAPPSAPAPAAVAAAAPEPGPEPAPPPTPPADPGEGIIAAFRRLFS